MMKTLIFILMFISMSMTVAVHAAPVGESTWRADHYTGSFTVVEDCINYPEKFWSWRIKLCLELDPKLTLPKPGEKHVRK